MSNVLTSTITKLFGGNKTEKDLKVITPYVELVNTEYAKLQGLSVDELRAKTTEFRGRIAEYLKDISDEISELRAEAAKPETSLLDKEALYERVDELTKKKDEQLEDILLELLPKAFAVVKETAHRFKENDSITATATDLDRQLAATREHITIDGDQVRYSTSWLAAGSKISWDMLHYDVQIIGGVVLHQGKIAEMATGEGKTLVATLPAYLNGLTGEGVHIVTVNSYLAQRDSEWMGPIMEFLGLRVDCIDRHESHSDSRRHAYKADIIYGTNNEFGFDYLRDNMVNSPGQMVQRKHHYAMVDEVDSVLVDDARTPLIISGPVAKGDQQEFHQLRPRVQRLVEAQRKVTSAFFLEAKRLIKEGKDGEKEGGLALLRAQRGLPRNKALIKFLSETGMKAKLLKTEAFYMRDQSKEMPTVDAELYFVIDEKNNTVELTDKGIDLLTGSGEDKDFFVLPNVGEEIADIERADLDPDEVLRKKDKLMQDFAIKSERVHTVQQLLKAYTLFEKDVEYVVMDDRVKIVDEQTGRVMDGRRYSDGLHQAIEAKENVKVEAATQTWATVTLQNYFRMYHKLAGMTGTAETEAGEFWEIYKLDVVVIPTNRPIQRDDRNDLVYKTKREKYSAIIEEVIAMREAGRPILVGTTNVEVSELLSRMMKLKGVPHNVLNAKQHQREADIVAEAGKPGQVTIATNMAGRGTDIKISQQVIDAGGLAIIGSERHESRRIDRQLRGRAGRQGDPGSSQFFVSLEDDLMRLFVSDRIAKIMDRLGYKEGEVIQHSMVTRSIERAQKKVEENNFGQRKRLLEYDDVMNSQRELIYKKRRHALFGERLALDIRIGFQELCEEMIQTHHAEQDYEGLKMEAIRFFSIELPFTEEQFLKKGQNALSESLYDAVEQSYRRKNEAILEFALPVIEDVYQNRGTEVETIAVPFTDGRKGLNIRVNLNEAHESGGRQVIREFEKGVMLVTVDDLWKEHLRQMDELKQAVQGAVYEQKDPLLIYKFEAFKLFEAMLSELNRDATSFLFKGSIPIRQGSEVKEAKAPQRVDLGRLTASRAASESRSQLRNQMTGEEGKKRQPVVKAEAERVGRNDPCPCGSGKKYKKCCGAADG